VKLVVTEFVTLDGVVEAPGFDEHKSGRNAWALRVQGDEHYAYNMDQIRGADAFLLGRRTWQIWAAFWPTAEGDPEIAARVNGMRKYPRRRQAPVPRSHRIGIETRVGLHTGEVERRETGIAGIAVHIAARLLGSASSGQVVVTRTVRDLATGTGVVFRPLGAVALRGVPGEWDLFEVALA
jgi:hypothetical protein